MGQTLTHGVYLPNEGERNCYSGLASNWRLLDGAIGTVAAHTTAIAGKADISHSHGNISNDGKVGTAANKPLITGTGGAVQAGSFGNQANTFCEGNDSRLSDARTPVAHTHTKSDVTDLFNSANTWTGDNTFTKFVKNAPTGLDISENPSSKIDTGFRIVDKDGNIISNLQYTKEPSGNSQIVLNLRTKDSNNVLVYRSVCLTTDQYSTWCAFRPNANNTISLGTPSYQWSSVYAQSYYYNGVAWGLDKENTWSKTNYFSPSMYQKAFTARASTPSSNEFATFIISDSNNTSVMSLNYANRTTGVRDLSLRVYSQSGDVNGVKVDKDANNNYSFCSINPNSTIELGTSTNKWKTLNGINPGALSLPDYSHPTLLDVTAQGLNWHTDATPNFYEIPANGYFAVIVQCPNTSNGVLDIFVNNTGIGSSDHGVYTGSELFCYVPVIKGSIVRVRARCDNYYSVAFYPCLGNV